MTAIARRIGIRDFRNSATQVIREVRETGEEVVITVDGEPVAVVRPFSAEDEAAEHRAEDECTMAEIRESRAKLTARWNSGLSATDAVSEQRR